MARMRSPTSSMSVASDTNMADTRLADGSAPSGTVAHRHGAHGEQRRLGAVVGALEVGAERAGHEREHHVVDGAAERVLDGLEVGERDPRQTHVAVLGDGPVPGRARGGERHGADRASRGRGGPARRAPPTGRCGRRVAAGSWCGGSARRRRSRAARRRWGSARLGSSTGSSKPSDVGGSMSNRCTRKSAPEAPSMAQWWTLVTMPTRSCLRPSMTHISHSGRLRSSWRLAICPASSPSSRRPPGAGAPMRRRW